MNRIEERFAKLGNSGRKGFIPFITAGDPDLETSLQIALKLAELNSDIIELGVPFSDPMADGPTIQLSSERALKSGATLPAILELVSEFRKRSETPVVLFSYLNPLLSYGIERLARDLPVAGVEGLLVTDVVEMEARAIGALLGPKNINLISLIAPTTTDERLRSISETATGFLYAVSRAGVTGARSEMSSEAENLVSRARRITDLPIAVGFGISSSAQIEAVWAYADAAVVGSALVNQIARAGLGNEISEVERFVASLLPEFAKGGTEI